MDFKSMLCNMLTQTYTGLINLYTASELRIMAVASAFGAFFSVAVGGTDQQITSLIYLVIVDYVTGLLAAWKTETLGSAKGFKGILKKVAIFAAIALCNTVDRAMAINTLRAMAIFGFAGVEAVSIIENIDRMGYGAYIPQFIRDRLGQIRQEKEIKL